MKDGANKLQQAQIRRMASEGVSVGDISLTLRITERAVKAFIPKKKRAPRKKVTDAESSINL